jgi:hypothetical protein
MSPGLGMFIWNTLMIIVDIAIIYFIVKLIRRKRRKMASR